MRGENEMCDKATAAILTAVTTEHFIVDDRRPIPEPVWTMRVRTARTEDLVPALTLTTFAEVPWNAPYYERCGLRPLADAELTGGLREIRAREATYGLDRRPRVCMRRETTLGEGPRRKE